MQQTLTPSSKIVKDGLSLGAPIETITVLKH